MVVQQFTSQELAKFKAADPDGVVSVRVGQAVEFNEQNEKFSKEYARVSADNVRLEEDNVRLEKKQQSTSLILPSLSSAFRTLTVVAS